ncbi:MAG: ribosome-associated heat shock protein Hsp15 [Spongiibacteraceae bacterium]
MSNNRAPTNSKVSTGKIRLDKWLWAARFFKTRSLAKQAIEGGKVHYNGTRSKVSKDVELGAKLTIRLGWDEKEVEILALSDQRRGAPEAQLLYQETTSSIEKRAVAANQRKALNGLDLLRPERPNKKQRRQIHRFKQKQQE